MTTLKPQPIPGSALPPLPMQDPIQRLPILILEPHSRCNCRCLMCDIWKSPRKDEISAQQIQSWLPAWQELGVRRIVLSGGEALMHSNLWEICALLRQAGIGLTLLSTGLLLARHASAVAAFIDDLIVSLDGPPAVHDSIRRIPRAYQRMQEGLAAVRAHAPDLASSARCTIQKTNFQYLRQTVQAAKDLGVQRISFLAVDATSEAFERPMAWDETKQGEVLLQPEDLPVLAEELERLETESASDFASGFIAESPEKLRRKLLYYFEAHLGMRSFPGNACNAPWVSAVVEASGLVRPCFFHKPMASLQENPDLAQILNAKTALEFRKNLDTEADPVCQRCVCSLQLRESAP